MGDSLKTRGYWSMGHRLRLVLLRA